MSKLVWDQTGERLFETGTDHGVVYPTFVKGVDETPDRYINGVAWNGLTGVTESPEGADATDLWADNIKYLSLRAAEDFKGTIEAYTYPDEFAILDGSAEIATGVRIGQQARKAFGFCYRTLVGNDVDGQEHGYKLHLLYGCTVSPSERGYSTVNDSPEAITFSWSLETTPVNVTGYKPTACVTIDSTKADPTNLATLEAALFGTTETDPYLPFPDEVASIMSTASVGG